MTDHNYGQFCPVAMASEILCSRWTLVVLGEMISGSTRFNEIRRGVPRMSPALLSKRLKDLEQAGIITRTMRRDGMAEYHLTARGEDLKPIVFSIGAWGQKWIDPALAMEKLDAQLLMWNIRRKLDPDPMPLHRNVIEFIYTDQPPNARKWWLIVEPGKPVDLCSIDPGHDVDLYVVAELRAVTSAWMGHSSFASEIAGGGITLTGDRALAGCMETWIGRSGYAEIENSAQSACTLVSMSA